MKPLQVVGRGSQEKQAGVPFGRLPSTSRQDRLSLRAEITRPQAAVSRLFWKGHHSPKQFHIIFYSEVSKNTVTVISRRNYCFEKPEMSAFETATQPGYSWKNKDTPSKPLNEGKPNSGACFLNKN